MSAQGGRADPFPQCWISRPEAMGPGHPPVPWGTQGLALCPYQRSPCHSRGKRRVSPGVESDSPLKRQEKPEYNIYNHDILREWVPRVGPWCPAGPFREIRGFVSTLPTELQERAGARWRRSYGPTTQVSRSYRSLVDSTRFSSHWSTCVEPPRSCGHRLRWS